MEELRKIGKDNPQYNTLYQDIIHVGEFDIEKTI